MAAVKRLPTNPHDRAVALVRNSMPQRDYREFPEPVARVLRASAAERAGLYAVMEDVNDLAQRVAEEIASSDDVVVDLSDDECAADVERRIADVEAALAPYDEDR